MYSTSSSSIKDLTKAYSYAAIAHSAQRRKSSDIPYIQHPIGVADIIASIGQVYDIPTLQAAVLHDTIEDTATTKEDLLLNFGEHVTEIVLEVSDDKELTKGARKRATIEHAIHVSKQAATVKLADLIYNVRDVISNPPAWWSTTRAQGYCVWAYAILQVIHDRHINDKLCTHLHDILFNSTVTVGDQSLPALPWTVDVPHETVVQYLETTYYPTLVPPIKI